MKNKVVFIVEDNEMTSLSIGQKLSAQKDLEIHYFTTVEKAIGKATDSPDVIILDHHLEETSGIGCIPLFREFSPTSHIIVYSEQTNIAWFDKAFMLGADAYLKKSMGHEDLVVAVLKSLAVEKETEDAWYIRITKNLFTHKEKGPKSKKIVVVEDNDMFALAVEQAFRESVFIKSEFYKSPDIFLKNIAELPDIYVLDYNLNHELNGRDLLIRIKEVNPKAVVIMLSAQKEVSVAIDLMKNGASYYLLKTRDNLRRLVKIIEGI